MRDHPRVITQLGNNVKQLLIWNLLMSCHASNMVSTNVHAILLPKTFWGSWQRKFPNFSLSIFLTLSLSLLLAFVRNWLYHFIAFLEADIHLSAWLISMKLKKLEKINPKRWLRRFIIQLLWKLLLQPKLLILLGQFKI